MMMKMHDIYAVETICFFVYYFGVCLFFKKRSWCTVERPTYFLWISFHPGLIPAVCVCGQECKTAVGGMELILVQLTFLYLLLIGRGLLCCRLPHIQTKSPTLEHCNQLLTSSPFISLHAFDVTLYNLFIHYLFIYLFSCVFFIHICVLVMVGFLQIFWIIPQVSF